jgi:prophage regulatory protein
MSDAVRFLRLPEVLSTTGLSRPQVYALMKRGLFPRQVRISQLSVAWIESEIQSWMSDRIATREGR